VTQRKKASLRVRWIAGDDNSADSFTKNLAGPLFEKHARTYAGDDEHMKDDALHVGD
jgi:hypothetical protein